MFTLTVFAEIIIIAVAAALLYAMCSFQALGALQQAGYDGKTYAAWLRRKGNMARSRCTLLAFLTVLAMLVCGLCFSFTGMWSAYIALIPLPLFVGLYCTAEKKALKVPLVSTARASRIYLFTVLTLAVFAFVLAFAGYAAAYYSGLGILEDLRYILLAALPLLLPYVVRFAGFAEKPISSARNKKYLAAAKAKLENSRCVKIGITGSFGKTSVKNFLAHLLSARYRVLATPESYNTPLGIAKTVEKEDLGSYDFFIAEMGARREGDIAQLCELVKPDHCILTGICEQHLETFKSLDAIVRAKGEILEGTKEGGFAVIGADENTEKLSKCGEKLNKISVGEHGECAALDIKCTEQGITFKLALGILQTECVSRLLGAHNAQDIALAAAMAYKLGMTKEEIAEGIASLDYVPHRLQKVERSGVTILDDAYNANIRGAAAAVEVLRLFGGRKFIVTPGLVELGVLEEKENAALGEKLVGLDRVILVGATLVTAVRNGYLAAGGDAEKLTIVPTLEKAQELLEEELAQGDTVLFLNDLPDIYN